VRGLSKLGQQRLQNTFDVFEHLVVPDPDDAIAKRLQFGVTLSSASRSRSAGLSAC